MKAFIVVEYKAMPEWPSPKRFDERVEALLKTRSDGSGFGGTRDFSFSFKTLELAKEAAKKVRAFIKKEKKSVYKRATVKVYEY